MKISILICSFAASKHLEKTMESLKKTFPIKKYKLETLVDVEEKRTGLANTTRRYMKLFKQSTGDIIVKSDDDVLYYPGWFEACYDVLQKDNKVAYVGPISHQLMIKLGIKHASSDRFPIKPKGYNCEHVISGMCWVFRRKLWEDHPYTLVGNTWHLDGRYAGIMRKHGLKTAALNAALCCHLGQDRFKSVPTDQPGKPPSEQVKKSHPEYDFRIF